MSAAKSRKARLSAELADGHTSTGYVLEDKKRFHVVESHHTVKDFANRAAGSAEGTRQHEVMPPLITPRDAAIAKLREVSDQEFKILLPKLERAFSEAKSELEVLAAVSSAARKNPVPTLSDIDVAEIKRRCADWETDKDEYRGRVFEWVKEKFADFIPGLTQRHLKHNRKLYNTFSISRSRNGGLPDWLDVPPEAEVILRGTPEPEQRRLIEIRQMNSARMRLTRRSPLQPS